MSLDSAPTGTATPNGQSPPADGSDNVLIRALAPLASMRLTVVLLALAIFIVFVGTLAQSREDIWQVVRDYFRIDFGHADWTTFHSIRAMLFAWVPWQVLFPPSFFPHMKPIPPQYGIWFPKGWLIGSLLFINLLAAHITLFRLQARGKRLVIGLVVSAVGVLLAAVMIDAGIYQSVDRAQLFVDWPSLRILWLLTQCSLVSLVLLGGFAILFGKRAGIVLLHFGIGTLMLGELLVGVGASEGQMQIVEGQTTNYVLDMRELELAIIDHSDPKLDHVWAIPQSRFLPGKKLQDAKLPFDIEFTRFMANSTNQPVTDATKNPATAGTGLSEIAVPATPISSTDKTGRSNEPAAYVRLFDKKTNKSLGTYLVSLRQWMRGRSEQVRVGSKSYELVLRYKHDYKPYSMHLIDVRFDPYMGTSMAKSYASTLRLVDPQRKVDRRVRIWMNNPLRFAGETFYQSNYGRDPVTQKEYTGLQVVTNRSWRIPYLACMMTSIGMLAQFWIVLLRFLHQRGQQPDPSSTDTETGPAAKQVPTKRLRKAAGQEQRSMPNQGENTGPSRQWIVPLLAVALAGLWLASKAYQPAPSVGQMNLVDFGQLPVMYEGRVKPMDTLARNSLRIISDKQTFKDKQGKSQPAIRWLLDVIVDSDAAMQHQVFRIQNLEVLDTLDLPRRPGFRYALDEFRSKLDEFDKQVRQARATPPEQRDLFAKKILQLEQRLQLYMLLRESFRVPQLRPDHLREDIALEQNRREQYSRVHAPTGYSTDGSGRRMANL